VTKNHRRLLEKVMQTLEFEVDMSAATGGAKQVIVRLPAAQARVLAKHLDEILAAHDEKQE